MMHTNNLNFLTSDVKDKLLIIPNPEYKIATKVTIDLDIHFTVDHNHGFILAFSNHDMQILVYFIFLKQSHIENLV